MRIGLDLTFYTGTRGGMETYVRHLYGSHSPLHETDEVIAITTADAHEAVEQWFPGVVHETRVGGTTSAGWAAAELLGVRPAVRRLGLDVLHCPANLAASVTGLPIVLTLHDVNAFGPGLAPGVAGAITRALIRHSAHRASAIVTVSRWSADEIRRYLPRVTAPVTVIPPLAPAAPGAFPLRRPAVLGTASVSRPLVLAGGNRLPHKNWDGLLRAMRRIPAAERPLLVVTGPSGDRDPLIPLVRDAALDQDVVITGYVAPEELEWLYRQAALYVLPSRYEGFGLGVIEAMSRGVPVLASDIPVLREVGGDAAWYVDTTDIAALADRMMEALHDPDGAADLRARGRERTALFDAETSTDRVRTVFSQTVTRTRSRGM